MWTCGRRRRALAAWVSAAGFGLVAWGLGTEAPTRAEAEKNIEQQKDLLRKLGTQVPATAGTETSMARRRWWNALDALGSSIWMVFGVRSGLRRPRRSRRKVRRLPVAAVAQLGVQPFGAADPVVSPLPQPVLVRAEQARPGQAGGAGELIGGRGGRGGGPAADRLAVQP